MGIGGNTGRGEYRLMRSQHAFSGSRRLTREKHVPIIRSAPALDVRYVQLWYALGNSFEGGCV